MAEGGSDLGSDPDGNETLSSYTEGPPSVADVLAMTVDELRTELWVRGASFVGGTKPELQAILLQGLGHVGTQLQFQEDPTELEAGTEVRDPTMPKMPLSTAVPVPVPSGQAVPDYTLPLPGGVPQPSKEGSDPIGSVRTLELQLQLRKLEIEESERHRHFKLQQEAQQHQQEEKHRHWEAQERTKESEREREKEERHRHWEAQERAKEREFELRRLELQRPQAPPVAARRDGPTAFKVENAVRLIPRFNDHDIETFLISFEKIAELNQFPRDKYSAILQAHLTGKALKVFTELSLEECKDYDTLKQALLTAYAVVPEVYRKRFRESSKNHAETYSEFAFRLTTQFKRWAKSEHAYEEVTKLRELILMEQFKTHLDPSMRGWLIDQKPQTMSELSRLCLLYTSPSPRD